MARSRAELKLLVIRRELGKRKGSEGVTALENRQEARENYRANPEEWKDLVEDLVVGLADKIWRAQSTVGIEKIDPTALPPAPLFKINGLDIDEYVTAKNALSDYIQINRECCTVAQLDMQGDLIIEKGTQAIEKGMAVKRAAQLAEARHGGDRLGLIIDVKD